MPYPGYMPPMTEEQRKRQDELSEWVKGKVPLKSTVWDPRKRENETNDESMGSEVER